jgi:cytochrome c-type biogenesis protein CcmH/NrfG
MKTENPRSAEALALERIAEAAREVQAASTALEKHFRNDGSHRPSMLELARLTAAMQELKDAREAFDLLVDRGTDPLR